MSKPRLGSKRWFRPRTDSSGVGLAPVSWEGHAVVVLALAATIGGFGVLAPRSLPAGVLLGVCGLASLLIAAYLKGAPMAGAGQLAWLVENDPRFARRQAPGEEVAPALSDGRGGQHRFCDRAVEAFVKDMCLVGPDYEEHEVDLDAAYTAWSRALAFAQSAGDLVARLEASGFPTHDTGGGFWAELGREANWCGASSCGAPCATGVDHL